MAVIKRLPFEVSQKIAAGEVIERPFSVVKELVENSLDAGSSEVRVELQEGGKTLIRVQDDGAGMSREDAGVCFDRHATSKIAGEDDLERISTLGFRGEALASIAAVSEVVLKTADGEREEGTRIVRKGGELVSESTIAFPRGTEVEVRDIFYNLPARRKFLRSERSELSLVVRYLSGTALAFPEVRFSLRHARRLVLDCPRVGSHRERIFQIYGKETLERLAEVDFQEGGGRVFGFASRPPGGRRDKSHQVFFVNKRPVKDRILQAALNQAYRGLLEKEQFAEAFLFLTLPYDEVDVNVHPTKAEVRFRESQLVFYLLLASVERALLKEKGIKEIYAPATETGPGMRVRETGRDFPGAFSRRPDSAQLTFAGPARPAEEKGRARVLGQYLDMYIVAASEDGLLVIDQHNAHERVLYEKYKEIDARKSWPQKIPLIPVLMDLTPAQIVNLEKDRTVLEEAGFRAEEMGGRTYALTGFPDIFESDEARKTFLELLDESEEDAGRKRERLLATLACRTAVKAHEPLAPDKMEYLVDELFRTANPSICPHGRPIVVKLNKSEIEKSLKRTS
ncbi:MAG: DNA mismatch repair endonuclease MutL [Candidatus Aminicenantes bacterium]|nr:DNA mismatch repair endonuclease MutL [Candidatus Aminicenantes bacterium]